MKNLEHIGIAVKSLQISEPIFEALIGFPSYKRENVESENVITSFFQSGETKVELLEATSSESTIAKFIEKRGEGIHHLAFAVDDIKTEMQRLQQSGFTLLNSEPKKGADNKLVCFLHPKSTNGVLVELCQEIKP
ncbi:MAG TPA: methylmalonyl-CoA epimerase [Bacteroidia bacterium]|nr:methylmalonyl-CoA epimerase [Bacteroidia bacterium]HMU20534.1 methylmalonyl-CoA epimerase [Bacteroidia bacterium]